MGKFVTKDKRKPGHCIVRGCGKHLYDAKKGPERHMFESDWDLKWGLVARVAAVVRGTRVFYICSSHVGPDGRFRKRPIRLR